MRRRDVMLGLATAGLARPVLAQSPAWPTRPVRILVPFPPGGSNDVFARPLGERLQARTGQPFVIENRAGAAGAIGAEQVARAAPDGTTLMVASVSVPTASIVQRTSWDPERDFEAITTLARAPFFIMVNPQVPARTVQELVALAKRQPGTLNYGTSGAGGINHFISESFSRAAGIEMAHVPYRGTAPAVTDLVAGNIQVMLTTVATASAAIREGRVRLLAATADGAPPTEGIPQVPTVRSQGIDWDFDIWWGLFAPRGLPPEMRAAIHAAVVGALGDPALARIYAMEGAKPAPVGLDEFPRILREDMVRFRRIAQAANIKPE
jgi:tripartite-type tricarboxylate transporter receptor subunit TctC